MGPDASLLQFPFVFTESVLENFDKLYGGIYLLI